MIKPPDQIITAEDFVEAFNAYGSIKEVGRKYNIPYGRRLRTFYLEAVQRGLMNPIRVGAKSREETKDPNVQIERDLGRLHAIPTKVFPVPEHGVKRYLFSCAQNNTYLHNAFWKSLLTLKNHYDAELHISRFTYVKAGLGALGDKTQITRWKDEPEPDDGVKMWWEPRLLPYLSDQRIEVAPGLIWCGEMNILPTAVTPLSGLEVYTGRRSGIFPHTKVAVESIPSGKHEPVKFNYTTGTVTKRNYIQRKAGLKAEFHHVYSALLVEVDSDGDWFCRQIMADSDGVIHDLDIRVDGDNLTVGNTVEAINWGDIHCAQMDKSIGVLCWKEGGILDYLQPKVQFFHDVLDFRAQSHHELKDPHRMYRRYIQGQTSVAAELLAVWVFLLTAQRSWCKNVIVDSNHHHHLGRWLKEKDARFDPTNAPIWFRLQAAVYKNITEGGEPNYLKLGLIDAIEQNSMRPGGLEQGFTFLDADESFIICEDKSGGIECGNHGHAGPNGSRGSPQGFRKMGRKTNIGHMHSAGIYDGVFVAGTLSVLDPDWTTGASSWSHTNILTYPNGKRTLQTCWHGKAWAAR